MEQEPSARQLRQEVYSQLSEFLRAKNTKPTWHSFLDRPVTLALISGLLIAGTIQLWQTREQRNAQALQLREHRNSLDLQYARALVNQKFELLRTLPMVYQKTGSALNGALVRRLWLTEELNKQRSKRNPKRISDWTLELKRFEEEFGKVESLEGVLFQIQTLYASEYVQAEAAVMRRKWGELMNLNETSIAESNANDGLTGQQITGYETSRKDIMENLSKSLDNLLRAMSTELLRQVRPATVK